MLAFPPQRPRWAQQPTRPASLPDDRTETGRNGRDPIRGRDAAVTDAGAATGLATRVAAGTPSETVTENRGGSDER
jgi:hypothetical protein